MTRYIRFASLNDRVRRQLVQAANFLHTSYNKTAVSEWDGMPCDLLVAAPTDRYGRYAIETVAYRGTPVVAITDEVAESPSFTVPSNASTAHLTRVIRKALGDETHRTPGQSPLLVRLASDPSLRGCDLDATHERRTLSIRPSLGRALANSYSELRDLQNRLLDDDWRIQTVPAADPDNVAGLASSPLEAFYLEALSRNPDALPPFRTGTIGLPDGRSSGMP